MRSTISIDSVFNIDMNWIILRLMNTTVCASSAVWACI